MADSRENYNNSKYMNISTREDNDDTILNTNIYRVMLGDKAKKINNIVTVL